MTRLIGHLRTLLPGAFAMLCTLSLGCTLVPAAHAAGAPAASDASVLDELWNKRFANPELAADTSVRELSGFVLRAIDSDWSSTKTLQLLRRIEDFRETRTDQQHFGNLSWYWRDHAVKDTNAVEFTTRDLCLAWFLLRQKPADLSGKNELNAALLSYLKLSLDGIRRHRVAFSYTNIALMKAWNLLAIHQIFVLENRPLPDSSEGERWFTAWMQEMRNNGIAEFNSPTYQAVSLENLGLIRQFIQSPDVRTQAVEALSLLWGQTLANWYKPSGRLGGTHSRDYDRLFQHNALDQLVDVFSGSAPLSDLGTLSRNAWFVPTAVRGQTLTLPRLTVQRWGQSSFARQYLGRNFSIGSASEAYHDMDTTPFAVNLGSGADTPVITWTADAREDWYGLLLNPDSGGHLKALHLKAFSGSVQQGSAVLMAAFVPTRPQGPVDSTIILPADARIFLDGSELPVTAPRSLWKPDPQPDNATTKVFTELRGSTTLLQLEDNNDKRGNGIAFRSPASEGQSFTLDVLGEGDGLYLYLNFEDRAGKRIGSENIYKLPAGRLARHIHRATAPAGTAYVKAWLYSTTAATGRYTLHDLQLSLQRPSAHQILAGFDFIARQPVAIPVPSGSVLGVWREDATLSIQLWAQTGNPASTSTSQGWVLHNDGLLHGALRLSFRHQPASATASSLAAGWHPPIAMHLRARDGLQSPAAVQEFLVAARDTRLQVSTATNGNWNFSALQAGTTPVATIILNPATGLRTLEPADQY